MSDLIWSYYFKTVLFNLDLIRLEFEKAKNFLNCKLVHAAVENLESSDQKVNRNDRSSHFPSASAVNIFYVFSVFVFFLKNKVHFIFNFLNQYV